MSVLVVGSVAFDDVTSPSGSVKNVLAGAATYFPWPPVTSLTCEWLRWWEKTSAPIRKNSSTSTESTSAAWSARTAKTFRWGGTYTENLNEAKTDYTDSMSSNFQTTNSERVRGLRLSVPGQHPAHPASQRAAAR